MKLYFSLDIEKDNYRLGWQTRINEEFQNTYSHYFTNWINNHKMCEEDHSTPIHYHDSDHHHQHHIHNNHHYRHHHHQKQHHHHTNHSNQTNAIEGKFASPNKSIRFFCSNILFVLTFLLLNF